MDERLRSLERAAAQGDQEAAGLLLVARVRQGTLEREALGLAAWLGDSGARRVLGAEAPPLPAPWEPPEGEGEGESRLERRRRERGFARTWCQGLGRFGIPVLTQAGLVLVEGLEGLLDSRRREDDPVRQALRASQRWLKSDPPGDPLPCVRAADAASEASRDYCPPSSRSVDYCLATAVSLVAYLPGSLLQSAGVDGLLGTIRHVAEAQRLAGTLGASDPRDAEAFPRALREQIRGALLQRLLTQGE